MSKIWYTSDLHFQHKFVAGLRGFSSPEEHDEVLTGNWNKVVKKDDIVFILGDFAMNWKNIEPKITALRGRKILITGNHDPMFPGNKDGWKHQARYIGPDLFEAIQPFSRRKVGDREFLLSHFPYGGDHPTVESPDGDDRFIQYRLRDQGQWLLHGHVHSGSKTIAQPSFVSLFGGGVTWYGKQIHVGVDAWDLKPVTEDEVMHMMAERDAIMYLGATRVGS
jgi:calcineurin-like phosphoesterase family protein